MKVNLRKAVAATVVTLLLTSTAIAVPILQIYIEGAVYDTLTEDWVFSSSSGGGRLWVIGNTGSEAILDVNLAVAYGADYEGLGITLMPTVIDGDGGFGIFTDAFTSPVVTADPNGNGEQSSVIRPQLTSGGFLAPHGIYGNGTTNFWQEFALGDMDEVGPPDGIADFITSFPGALPLPALGQINAYDFSFSGDMINANLAVHFDVYNHVEGSNHASFAPFSHDGGGTPAVPVPPAAGIGMLGIGLVALIQGRKNWTH